MTAYVLPVGEMDAVEGHRLLASVEDLRLPHPWWQRKRGGLSTPEGLPGRLTNTRLRHFTRSDAPSRTTEWTLPWGRILTERRGRMLSYTSYSPGRRQIMSPSSSALLQLGSIAHVCRCTFASGGLSECVVAPGNRGVHATPRCSYQRLERVVWFHAFVVVRSRWAEADVEAAGNVSQAVSLCHRKGHAAQVRNPEEPQNGQ